MSRALYFSGHTQYGQSGRFLDENVQSPSAIELSPMRYVSAGGKHINAISGSLINSRLSVPCPSLLNECIEEGLLYSWGDNEFGQLGRSAQYVARQLSVPFCDVLTFPPQMQTQSGASIRNI